MLRTMLISKLHNVKITEKKLHYMGSITIDKKILKASGMQPNEKVEIYNIDDGERFATYILEGEEGSGVIGINGAAARLVSINDRVIVVNYGLVTEEEAKNHKATVLLFDDEENKDFTKVIK